VSASLEHVSWLLQNRWPSTPTEGAALQLAIWDIVTDGADGFAPGAGIVTESTGSNATDSTVLADAIQYERDSSHGESAPGIVYHNYSGTTRVQTLMGPNPDPTDPNPGPVPVPEPAALLLIIFQGIALTGVSCLCGLRRRARTN
jgi:hypothetical protein